ncbi:MAG: hypothetical protein IT260_22025 [Saprospiraceae bacterium]|nr:hypothetical protein [Saprospiraceae bacterium]
MKNMLLWAGLATVLMCVLLLWIDRIATIELEKRILPEREQVPLVQPLKTLPAHVAPTPVLPLEQTSKTARPRKCAGA